MSAIGGRLTFATKGTRSFERNSRVGAIVSRDRIPRRWPLRSVNTSARTSSRCLEFARRSFVDMGVPSGKLRKVPYGVDLTRFRKVACPAEQGFDVLFVGAVSFQKGVPYLLNAFRRLEHPHKRLRIVGAMQPEMSRYLEGHPPGPHVEFLGHVPQDRLRLLMSRSHVMVLPSVQEGLALVQAQALACGCPVIGTVNSGAEDLFTDGVEGFIVAHTQSLRFDGAPAASCRGFWHARGDE